MYVSHLQPVDLCRCCTSTGVVVYLPPPMFDLANNSYNTVTHFIDNTQIVMFSFRLGINWTRQVLAGLGAKRKDTIVLNWPCLCCNVEQGTAVISIPALYPHACVYWWREIVDQSLMKELSLESAKLSLTAILLSFQNQKCSTMTKRNPCNGFLWYLLCMTNAPTINFLHQNLTVVVWVSWTGIIFLFFWLRDLLIL